MFIKVLKLATRLILVCDRVYIERKVSRERPVPTRVLLSARPVLKRPPRWNKAWPVLEMSQGTRDAH